MSVSDRMLGELSPLARIGRRLHEQGIDFSRAQIITPALLASKNSANLDQRILPVLIDSPRLLSWASAIAATVLDVEIPQLIPSVIDDEGRNNHSAWSRLCETARDQALITMDQLHTPERILDLIGDEELRDYVAFLRRGFSPHPLVLIDGPFPAVATLLAGLLQTDGVREVLPVQPGTTEIERLTWERLELRPILPWHTSCADGRLASLALAAIDAASSL